MGDLIGGFDPELISEPGQTPAPAGWLTNAWQGLQDFATSDRGKGLAQALGVGLLGLQKGRPLQGPAFQFLLERNAEREKMALQTKQAVAAGQALSNLYTISKTGDHGAILDAGNKILADPTIAPTLGPAGVGMIAQMMGKSAEALGKSAITTKALAGAKLEDVKDFPGYVKAYTGLVTAGMPADQANTFLTKGTPFGRMSDLTLQKGPDGQPLGWIDKHGGTYAINPQGGTPVAGPLAPAESKPEVFSSEQVLKQFPHVGRLLEKGGYTVSEVFRRANTGKTITDAQGNNVVDARTLLNRAMTLSSAISESQTKPTGNPADLATAKVSAGKYASYADLVYAARQGDTAAATMMTHVGPEIEGARVREVEAAEKYKLKNTPIGLMPGNPLVIDAATGEPARNTYNIKIPDVESGKYVILHDEQDKKAYTSMRELTTATIPMMRSIIPNLAKNPTGVVKQWAEGSLAVFGVPTVAGIVKSMESLKNRIAIGFQSGSAQNLSDKDSASAEFVLVKSNDSQQTATLKADSLEAMAKLKMAAMIGNAQMANTALRSWRLSINKVLAQEGRYDLIQQVK